MTPPTDGGKTLDLLTEPIEGGCTGHTKFVVCVGKALVRMEEKIDMLLEHRGIVYQPSGSIQGGNQNVEVQVGSPRWGILGVVIGVIVVLSALIPGAATHLKAWLR